MLSAEDIIDALITEGGSPPNDTPGCNSDETALWIKSLYERLPIEDDTFCRVSLWKTYCTRVQPLVHSILQGESKDVDDESLMLRLKHLDSFLSLLLDKSTSSSNATIVFTPSGTLQELFMGVLFPALEDVMKISLRDSSPLLTMIRLVLLRWMQLTLTHHVRPDLSLMSPLQSLTCQLLAATLASSNDEDDNEIPFLSSLDPVQYFDASMKETSRQTFSLDLSGLQSKIVRHLQTPTVSSHSWSATPFVPVWQQLHALVVQLTVADDEIEEIDENNAITFWQQKVLVLLDRGDGWPMTKAMIQWVHPPPAPPTAPALSLHLGRLKSPLTALPVETKIDAASVSPELQRRALLHFFAVSIMTSPNTFEMHWIPLIFAWLQSSRDAEICAAVLILERWLQTSNDIQEMVWSNLCTILQRLRKIHRQGWTLIWLGSLERRLFHYGFARGILESQRIRQSLQEWWLVLDRNNRHYTQDHLIYGLLCIVTPLLYDCVHLYTHLDNGIDLGRLGLSSLLPILEGAAGYGEVWQCFALDEGSSDVSLSLSVMVHFLALASLSNLLIFSYPIVTRHAGKILCALLLFIRRLDDCEAWKSNTSPSVLKVRRSVQHCALQVAAMAMILLRDAAEVVLNRIVQGDQYDQGVVDIIGSIRIQALKISQETA